MAIFNYILYQAHPWPPCSLWNLKAHPGLPHCGLKLPCFLAYSTMPWLVTGCNDFFVIKLLFSLSSLTLSNACSSELQIAGFIAVLINAWRHQRSWLYFICAYYKWLREFLKLSRTTKCKLQIWKYQQFRLRKEELICPIRTLNGHFCVHSCIIGNW